MHSFYKGVLSMGFFALSCAGLGGCGAAEELEDGQIDSTEQAFSSQSCSTAGANRTFTGKISPEVFSPRTYNNCTKTYVVDILNYDPAFTGPGGGGGPDARLIVRDVDAFPRTQAACEGLVTSAIFYKKVNNQWVDQTGPIAQRGIFLPNGPIACVTPQIDYTDLVPGASYRVAVTSREDADALTRVVAVESLQAENLR